MSWSRHTGTLQPHTRLTALGPPGVAPGACPEAREGPPASSGGSAMGPVFRLLLLILIVIVETISTTG